MPDNPITHVSVRGTPEELLSFQGAAEHLADAERLFPFTLSTSDLTRADGGRENPLSLDVDGNPSEETVREQVELIMSSAGLESLETVIHFQRGPGKHLSQ